MKRLIVLFGLLLIGCGQEKCKLHYRDCVSIQDDSGFYGTTYGRVAGWYGARVYRVTRRIGNTYSDYGISDYFLTTVNESVCKENNL